MWDNVRLLQRIANGLFAVAACILVLAALSWVTHRSFFSLKNIRMEAVDAEGLRHINAPTIRANLVGRLQGNFFTINLDAARQAIESVPWVRRASVRRDWPNGLIVTIEEHEPLGTWGALENAKLLNTYGEVFVANVAEAEDEVELKAFSGPDGSSAEVVAKLEDLEKWVAPLGAEVAELHLSERYAWSGKLSNGLRLELGRELSEADKTTMAARAERFVQAWPQVTAKWGKQIDYADLRYPNGFAIRATGMKFLPDGATSTTVR